MRQAHLRDAVALINYFVYLEEVLKVSKTLITEAAGANKLLQFRQELKDFVCPSFATISSSGANGAIIHYKPPEVGSKGISIDEMYLLDSGGQFRLDAYPRLRRIQLLCPRPCVRVPRKLDPRYHDQPNVISVSFVDGCIPPSAENLYKCLLPMQEYECTSLSNDGFQNFNCFP